MKRFSGAVTLLLVAGCLNAGDSSNTISLPFDFDVVGEGFTAGVAEIHQDDLSEVELVGELRALPDPLPDRDGLYLAGTNTGGSLFLFMVKRFTGLLPNETYDAELLVEFATNIHQGCNTGVGPTTFVKAGASNLPVESIADITGIFRMSIDKGTGAAAGQFTQHGDIRNGAIGCPTPGTYAVRTTEFRSQAASLTTDEFGGFWLWVGLESTAPGRPEVYFGGVVLRLTH